MPSPYRLMLLTSAPAPPAGDGWIHEPKLDGWRFLAEISDERVRLWSRGGHDWAPKLPELQSLTGLGDIVLDCEMIVVSPDGRADFELLTTRLNRRPGDPTPGPPASLYVFDILRHEGQDIRNRPWSERRAMLNGLELAERTEDAARPTVISPDGTAMHQATADIGAEGTVSYPSSRGGHGSRMGPGGTVAYPR
jgi:bifunctional non-homologous end joining protein LigD